MWKFRGYAWMLGATLLCALPSGVAQPLAGAGFDVERSWLGFEVRTRFGQRLMGEFPRYEGRVETLPDGRHRVHLRVATGEAVIPDRPRYTSWMHGQSFFDSVRYPWMEFVSDPYSPALLREGGPLKGRLSLRGVTRDEELRVLPAPCLQPGRDCDIQVVGAIERADYGMREWQFALTGEVRLEVRVRLRGDGQ